MYLAAVVMLASYSASVLSHIMTKTYKLPFNTFEEFLEIGTYTLVVERYSGHYTHFQVSPSLLFIIIYLIRLSKILEIKICKYYFAPFNWPNSSSRNMALGSTQPLTEMSNRNLPGGKGRLACKADNLTAICEPII
jgi:hypothetical protein